MNAPSIIINSDASEYLNTSSVFGEVNKTIVSRNFKGGKINNFFGETNLDFSYADISGVVVLDISQAFGEINLTVPANWRVESDISQFLASTCDERTEDIELKNASKVLILVGNSVFAAVKITTNV
jgi:predicted membrane protein